MENHFTREHSIGDEINFDLTRKQTSSIFFKSKCVLLTLTYNINSVRKRWSSQVWRNWWQTDDIIITTLTEVYQNKDGKWKKVHKQWSFTTVPTLPTVTENTVLNSKRKKKSASLSTDIVYTHARSICIISTATYNNKYNQNSTETARASAHAWWGIQKGRLLFGRSRVQTPVSTISDTSEFLWAGNFYRHCLNNGRNWVEVVKISLKIEINSQHVQ